MNSQLLKEAAEKMETKSYDHAIHILNQILNSEICQKNEGEDKKQLAEVYKMRAICYKNKNEFVSAYCDITTADDLYPENKHILSILGHLEYLRGDYEKSIAVCRKNFKLNSKNYKILMNMTYPLEKQRKIAEALAILEKIVPDIYDIAPADHEKLEERIAWFKKELSVK